MLPEILHEILHAAVHSLKLLPFLFLTYAALEFLESRTENTAYRAVRRAGWLGPLWGSALGVIPQCGFSVAAANLYAGRAISVGTLLAVFLSTSDEMLPILISSAVPSSAIVKILLTKILLAMAMGFLIDAFCRLLLLRRTGQSGTDEGFEISRLCERAHCHCGKEGIWLPALKHTVQILLFLFAVMAALNLAFHFIGEGRLIAAVAKRPAFTMLLAALLGFIPSCGTSVLLTQMFLRGVLNAGEMMAGLLVNAGVGLLVLFRVNPSHRENFVLAVLLGLCGIAGGFLVMGLGLCFQ